MIIVSIAVLLEGNIKLGYSMFSDALSNCYLPLLSTFIALQLLYLTGLADDLIGIKYRAKFVVQLICAIFLLGGGVWFSSLGGVLGIGEVSPWFGYPSQSWFSCSSSMPSISSTESTDSHRVSALSYVSSMVSHSCSSANMLLP